ncbi:hypothetical protein L202_01155 [Cryptococcus amylolentus CBS 6039]|uniref:Chitobiosyldiphosphodolichol beta-mannosyltransferase n=2 Tax=Cryptococcus amylolentus TaxID=104669 RepID=A0A1E3I2R9_9TREE|nr:hypothetical protein L202_01155 [Cryptococcus amylolentus CBS 6039]ODN82904.1 hypothetical protein L202_01155 [Cryptococcus amylolentus CBS 6039]ODO10548.1 hypothetical protein I350_01145 [Cryptococcus amylolentus CBS 6273]
MSAIDVALHHPIAVLFAFITLPPVIFLLSLYRRVSTRPSRKHTATVLVLGDIGRSPRMMYHADSFAKNQWATYVVGYENTAPIPSLLENQLVSFHGLAEAPTLVDLLPWALRAPIRVSYQIMSVIYICIWSIPCNTEVLLVQNPPSIPTLALAQAVCFVTKTKLIIDWHNTGYSILAMRVGEHSPLVKVATCLEAKFGKKAFAHLFVTKALEEFLVQKWDLRGKTTVLHDRPPQNFRRTGPMVQHELFHRLLPELEPPFPSTFPLTDPADTIFTEIGPSGMPAFRTDKPALVVSSTSWTADEDFTPFVVALDAYQRAVDSGANLPKLVVIITGRGGLRAQFETIVASREATQAWKDIIVRCVFLPARDYPALLGSADLGVSLHSSSSGRDLPMKVVDMFGCGVPVLARNFICLHELVKNGKNGRVFESGTEMGQLLIELFDSFPVSPDLESLKSFFERGNKPRRTGTLPPSGAGEDEWSSWEDNWDRVVLDGVLNDTKH